MSPVRHTLRLYYLLSILCKCGVGTTTAIYPTYLLAHGLNLFEANLVNLVFFVTLFLCEVPTGAFADVYGRRISCIISCALFTAATILFACTSTFWGFACAEALAAMGATFMSGALNSWAVDTLAHHNYHGSLAHIFAKASLMATGAALCTAVLGSYLFEVWHSLPWLLESMFFIVAGVVMYIYMKEEYFERTIFSVPAGVYALKETVTTSVQYGLQNSNVRFVMLLVLVLNISVMAPNMQWQPYFAQWIEGQTGLGFVWAGMAATLMVGAKLVPILLRHTSERRALLLCHTLTALCLMGAAASNAFSPALVLFLAHELGRGAFQPIKEAYLHDAIPKKERATISSFESVSHHLGGAVGLVASGLLAQYGSIPLAWMLSGMMLCVCVAMFWKNGK